MLGIALRQGVNWPHAMKELGACVEAGERLRQDARRVADSFHDESINDEMARTITGQWAVDEWAKKQEGWAGRASNMLRDLLAGSEAADAFRRVVRPPPTANEPSDPRAKLDRHLDALDHGLRELRGVAERLEPSGGQTTIPEAATVPQPAAPAESVLTAGGRAAVPPHASVFLVHGRNEHRKVDVARTLERSGDHKVVILHEVSDRGRTLIEKFEEEASAAAYAVILVTGDDLGRLGDAVSDQPRARQNVIFELGWFAGRLGRARVTVLYDRGVELPSDYGGVTYTLLDEEGVWRFKLVRELQDAGLSFDANRLPG
jgi:predicted nucleotide-binding protein